jgi:thioredoxin 1
MAELPVNNPGIIDVGLEEFDRRVLQASFERPVLVDLWAEWCPPCLVIAPVLEAFIHENDGAILLARVEVDVDDNMKLAGRYKVRGFPTVILFEQGQEVGRFSGARTLGFIRQFADENIRLI